MMAAGPWALWCGRARRRLFAGALLLSCGLVSCAVPSPAAGQSPSSEPAPPASAAAGAAAAESSGRSAAPWRSQIAQWKQQMEAALHAGNQAAFDRIARQVAAVRDRAALGPLEAAMADGPEKVCAALLEPLPEIGGARAIALLVRTSVTRREPAVCLAAQKCMKRVGRSEQALALYLRYLGSPQYCDQAAQAMSSCGLGRRDSLADPPDRKLTYALVNALVSYRRFDVPHEEYWTWGRLFVTPGGWDFPHGVNGRQVFTPVYRPVRHASVHKTLVEYTGQDYGYDQRAWKSWYQSAQGRTRRR